MSAEVELCDRSPSLAVGSSMISSIAAAAASARSFRKRRTATRNRRARASSAAVADAAIRARREARAVTAETRALSAPRSVADAAATRVSARRASTRERVRGERSHLNLGVGGVDDVIARAARARRRLLRRTLAYYLCHLAIARVLRARLHERVASSYAFARRVVLVSSRFVRLGDKYDVCGPPPSAAAVSSAHAAAEAAASRRRVASASLRSPKSRSRRAVSRAKSVSVNATRRTFSQSAAAIAAACPSRIASTSARHAANAAASTSRTMSIVASCARSASASRLVFRRDRLRLDATPLRRRRHTRVPHRRSVIILARTNPVAPSVRRDRRRW